MPQARGRGSACAVHAAEVLEDNIGATVPQAHGRADGAERTTEAYERSSIERLPPGVAENPQAAVTSAGVPFDVHEFPTCGVHTNDGPGSCKVVTGSSCHADG